MTHEQPTPAPVEVTQADVMRSLNRAIDRIMGIEIEAMGGDNLAVTLCSHFDRDDGSEPDDNGWSEIATNAYDEIKQEIAGLFVPVREAIQAFARHRTASAPAGEVEPVAWMYSNADDLTPHLSTEQWREPEAQGWTEEALCKCATHPAPPADLVEALKRLLEEYVSNIDSHRLGGFYLDPEKEECVVEARAALAKHGGA